MILDGLAQLQGGYTAGAITQQLCDGSNYRQVPLDIELDLRAYRDVFDGTTRETDTLSGRHATAHWANGERSGTWLVPMKLHCLQYVPVSPAFQE